MLRSQAQQWKSWLTLRHQIQHDQKIIEPLEIVEQFSHLEGNGILAKEQQDLFQIVSQFKQSLLLAMNTERLLREQKCSLLTELTAQGKYWQEETCAKVYNEMLQLGINLYQKTQSWR